MPTDCLPNQKETTQKYRKIARIDQARMIQAIQEGQTQESVAKQNNVPRTTVEHWIKRMKELKDRHDPEIAAFFESPAGISFLHRLVIATLVIFHTNGGCGLPSIRNFLTMSLLSKYVGSSLGTLHKMSEQIDQLLKEFGESERKRLGELMPYRQITGCGDETFFHEKMMVVFMEASSGFILAEQIEEKRDAPTWKKVIDTALEGLNVQLIQVTGDEAGGLTSAVTNLLGIHKSPDLFHIQQDITKGLTGHLARQVERAEAALKKCAEEKKQSLEEFQEKLRKPGSTIEDRRVVKSGQKLLEMDAQEKACCKRLERAKCEQAIARQSRRAITEQYHPFDLGTGDIRNADRLNKELSEAYNQLESIAEQAHCTDNQKKRLKKSRGMTASLTQTLAFFWFLVTRMVFNLQLLAEERMLFEQFLLPIEYLKMVEGRSGKRERGQAASTRKQLENALRKRDGPLLEGGRWQQLQRSARECAEFFQRSSSCVEGHNGALSLRHHAARHLSSEKLNSRVVLHNYFSKRSDGTTAAERFFHQEPKEVFNWLLEKVSWPVRPRNRWSNEEIKTRSTASLLTDLKLVA
jgi:uncharacterized protein DUF6399/CENP-B-like protein